MKHSEFLKNNYDELVKFIDCMRVGVWVTDAVGRVVMVNKESVKTGGLEREEVIGKTTEELIETGYILDQSSVLNAIKSGKEESIVQEEGEGGQLLATSVPLYYDDKIDLIVCIERDISDIVSLENLLSRQKNITQKLQHELIKFRDNKSDKNKEMMASSPNTIYLKERAISIGALDATVMITGESGTGKEVVANLIHKNSKRAEGPFVKVNCAAIPESLLESEFFGYERGAFTGADKNGKAGLFELADGGTLFLDEIGEMSLQVQSKLLRVLQEKEIRRIGGDKSIPVNVRIISATNRNLKDEMEKGCFRSDLYYRLFVVPIEVPPLRNRRDDIAHLANHFVQEFNEQYNLKKYISDDALKIMEAYDWPGNVRELRNVVERLVVGGAGDKISEFQTQMCLQGKDNGGYSGANGDDSELSLAERVGQYEKQLIIGALEEYGNASEASKALKVSKSAISKKRKKYGI